MSTNGFNELSKKLNQLAQNVENLSNTTSASLTDILTPAFISQHTKFSNLGELFEAGEFDVSSQAAFEAIDENELDAFIQVQSSFSSWKEMLSTAGTTWTRKKLGL